MRTLNLDEFKTLVSEAKWQHLQEINIVEPNFYVEAEDYDHDTESHTAITLTRVLGQAEIQSKAEGLCIVYTEGFDYTKYQPHTFSAGTDGQDEVWSIEGFNVVDDDGDVLNPHELADYLNDSFSDINYDDVKAEIEEIDETHLVEGSDMETITLEIDNKPSIRFSGEQISSVASSDNNAMGSSYSGNAGRWTELAVYKTAGGKYVCHQIGRTRWAGERDRFSGQVCDTLDQVKEFFGYRWLAKELYEEAGIDFAIDIK